MMDDSICEADLRLLDTADGRAEFIRKYAKNVYPGHTVDGEETIICVDTCGMSRTVYQSNHWIMKVVYDEDGYMTEEHCLGKW